jgi:hypothetical protein
MINERVHVAFQRPVAPSGVRIQSTPCLHSEVGSCLDRPHGKIFGRLEDDRSLATDPRDNRWPVLVIMASPRLTLLAAPTRAAAQRLLPTLVGLPLVAGRMVEVIRFHCACQLALGFVGHGRIPQPPAPAIAGPDMAPQLSGNASRRTRQAQQAGREDPVRQRPLAPVEQGLGEVVEGAITTMTPVAFASRSILVRAPLANVVALAARTLQWPVLPPQRMDIRLALFSIEEVGQMREYRHG